MPYESEAYYTLSSGERLFYRTIGDIQDCSKVLFCIHGLTRNSLDFSLLFEAYDPPVPVLSIDVIGRGRSDRAKDWRDYEVPVYAGHVLELMNGLGIERSVFLGTSMGGLISMTFAVMQGDRTAGIMLNDIGPEIDPKGLERISAYAGKVGPVTSWAEAIAQTKDINLIAYPDFSEADWEKMAHRLYREDEQGTPVLAYDPDISKAFANIRENAPTPWALFDQLTQIPMLVIRGGTSDILSAETVAKMQVRHPMLSACEVPGHGHAPALNEPEAVAAIGDFIAQH